jgi:hypothetical protein
MIDARTFFIAYHLAAGRLDLALIVAAFPVEAFAEIDALMRAAWLAGAADAARKD